MPCSKGKRIGRSPALLAATRMGSGMAVKQIQYRGMTVKAAAFEVMESHRFIVLVSISRMRARSIDRKEKFFEPPSADGFFDDPYEGIDTAVAYARAIIDGRVPDLTVEDL